MARQAHDFYPTPWLLSDAICVHLCTLLKKTPTCIIEPSAGSGAFVMSASKVWNNVPIYAFDIRPECEKPCKEAGAAFFYATDWAAYVRQPITLPENSLVLGNPPFRFAQEHITLTLPRMQPGSHLAFLLKANFLGGVDRALTLWKLPGFRYYLPIAGRPSFVKTEKATNGFEEYGVYVWEIGYTGRPEIIFPHIHWRT